MTPQELEQLLELLEQYSKWVAKRYPLAVQVVNTIASVQHWVREDKVISEEKGNKK